MDHGHLPAGLALQRTTDDVRTRHHPVPTHDHAIESACLDVQDAIRPRPGSDQLTMTR